MMINNQTIAYAQGILGNRTNYFIGYLVANECAIKRTVRQLRNVIKGKTRGLGQFRYFWILTDRGLAFAISGDATSVDAAKAFLNNSDQFTCTPAYEGRHSRPMSAVLSKAVETHVTIPNQRTFGGSYLSK